MNDTLSTGKIILLLFTIFFVSGLATAQTPTSAPPINESETIKITTTLIQTDVTVTDKNGKVINDLKPEDFEVYENGRKQNITSFSLISTESKEKQSENSDSPSFSTNKNSVPIPPVKLKPEQVRRTYALVVDDLGLSFVNIHWVQQGLRKFVNEQMQDGDLAAILRTGSGAGALQSFTSDKRQLLAAIDKIKWNSYGRSGISASDPILKNFKDEVQTMKRSSVKTRGVDEDKAAERRLGEFRNNNFAVGTLGALSYIVQEMGKLPGRKAVVLFSEGFTLTSTSVPRRILNTMKALAELANRSSVVFYTLDPRGLQAQGMARATDDITEVIPDGYDPTKFVDPRDDGVNDFRESQQSLQYLAYETGGIPYLNQNNLNAGLQRIINDQDSYYLIGYQPDEDTFDPTKNRLNKLEIKLTRPDLKVRYRSEFFNASDQKTQPEAQNSQQKLMNALTSPFSANDINLILYPVYHNEETAGNVIQALVYIDAKGLKFSEANGKRKANFDLAAMMFGDNGVPIDRITKNYTVEADEKVYQNMMANGFVYNLPIAVKKPGAYQFRVALRDTNSDKLGSASQFVEVPDFKKQMSISNLLVDNFTPEEWRKISLGGDRDASERSLLLDTTLRRFKNGTVLRYDYAIYNPKKSQSLSTRLRLVRDGKTIYEEPPVAIKTAGQTDLSRLQIEGAVTLGKNLEPGDYILQITADDGSGEKNAASQFVQFEIIK